VRDHPTLIRLAVSAAGLLWVLIVPAIATADTGDNLVCAPPPIEKAIASADLVFVGLVTSSTNEDRTASVLVSEVWQGDVDEIVAVDGAQDAGSTSASDRTFSVGTTYLFIPTLVDGHLVDNSCSSTVVWGDKIAGLRPAVTHLPRPATPPAPSPFAFLGTLAGPLWTAAIIGGGAYGFALLVARRRDS
jgi:hypothetical protein